MTRSECLDAARACINTDRQNDYGSPENNFATIASLWSSYLDHAIKPHDVAAMLALLKIARIRTSPGKADNWVDLAGYAACGVEAAMAKAPVDEVAK